MITEDIPHTKSVAELISILDEGHTSKKGIEYAHEALRKSRFQITAEDSLTIDQWLYSRYLVEPACTAMGRYFKFLRGEDQYIDAASAKWFDLSEARPFRYGPITLRFTGESGEVRSYIEALGYDISVGDEGIMGLPAHFYDSICDQGWVVDFSEGHLLTEYANKTLVEDQYQPPTNQSIPRWTYRCPCES